MNRKFLVNIIFLVIVNLLIKPFWFFGIEVTVQNQMGNEAYGTYFSLFSFSLIFNFMLDLGITNFNTREISKHNHLISKYLSNVFGIRILLGLVYAIVCFTASFFLNYSKYELFILSFLVLNQFLAAFILYLRSNISGLLLFFTDSLLSVLDKALMILFLGVLLWSPLLGGKFKIEYFVWCQTSAYIITGIVAAFVVFSKCEYFKPTLHLKYLFLILKKSLPFSILVLLMFIYNRIEPVLLERLLEDGKVQAGIYAQGFRFLEVLSNFAYLFPVLLLPLFSKLLKDRNGLGQLLLLAVPLLIIPALSASLSLAVYSNSLMNSLYHQPASGETFQIVIMGLFGISLTYLYGTLLTANGNLKQLNIMALCAVVLNIGLNFLFIPLYKAKGAAMSSFITQTITGLVQLFLAYKYIKINIGKSLVIRGILWAGTFPVVLYLAKTTIVNWQIGVPVSIAAGIGLAFVFRLFNIREMIKLIFSTTK